MDNFIAALWLFTDPYLIAPVLLGTIGGVIVGALPGRSRRTARARPLPKRLAERWGML